MATLGNTIIDFQGLQTAQLEAQLEAVADLARVLELVAAGQAAPCESELEGDVELLHSLIWPLRSLASTALDTYRKHREEQQPGGPDGPLHLVKDGGA